MKLEEKEERKKKITVSLDPVLVERIKRELKVIRIRDIEEDNSPSSFSSLINSLLTSCLDTRQAS